MTPYIFCVLESVLNGMVRRDPAGLRIDSLDEAIDCVVGRDTAFEVDIVREVDERSTSFLSALAASNNVGMFHRF